MYRNLTIAVLGLGLVAVAGSANAQNQGNRENRQNRNEARENRDTYADWKRTNTSMDKLPGPVKAAFGKEANQDKVTNVVELSKDNKKVYQAEISKAEGERGRVIRVDDSGKVLKEINTTERGREKVDYATLPGEVKNTISKMTNGKQPDEVTQITRGGDTFYAFRHDGKQVFVGKNGKTLTENELPKQ